MLISPRFRVKAEWMLVTPQPCHVVCDILSDIAKKPDVKVITFNHEGIFTKADINRTVVKGFVDSRGDMNYPIYIDSQRVAIRCKVYSRLRR